MTEPAHAEDLAARLVAGQVDDDVVRWLVRSAGTWARADGALSLERALGLFTTPGRRRRRRRNHWLAMAARELPPSGAAPARALHQALRQFIERGLGRAWRDLESPPPGAARLNVALFEVARCSGWRVLSMRRIEQLLPAEISSEKFRAEASTMLSVDTTP